MLPAFALVVLSLVSTGGTPASAQGPFTTITVDSTTLTGMYSSVAIAPLGPVVSYYDATNTSLKLARCNSAACLTPHIVTLDNTGTATGTDTSVGLKGANGNAAVSYYDVGNANLKVAVCDNVTCAAPTTATPDSSGNVGQYTSLKMNGSSFAVVSYYDATNTALRLAVCTNAPCTTSTKTTVDNTGFVGSHTSLKLNGAGNPVISYLDDANASLRVAVCSNATCTAPTLTTVSAVGEHVAPESTSLELNGSGFPVISYSDLDTGDLKVRVCDNTTCTTSTLTTVDGTGAGAQFSSLKLNSAGFPVIAYYDSANQAAKVAVCNDATCGTTGTPFRTLTTVDNPGVVGTYTSLALDTSGNPVISYHDQDNGALKVANVSPTAATINVYAGAAATAPPTPDQADAAGASPAATAAKLGWPTNLVFDASGNLYFTDRYNHTVRMVSADGSVVTTIAGQPGLPCLVATDLCGDQGPATSANLRSPWGIAVDGATPPNIYISDYGDHRVRKISAGTGVITTIAGTGTAGYNADGIPAVNSHLNYPSGLTLDADGAVLVADRGNNRIRKIDTLGAITTFLGTGTASPSAASCSTLGGTTCTLDQPTDIKVRGSSAIPSVLSMTDFFIADRANSTVLVTRDGTGSGVGIIADRIGAGGAGSADGTSTAQFNQPVSLAYDALQEQLYIADSNNLRVRRYSLVNLNVTTIAGNGTGKLGTSSYSTPANGGAAALSTALNFPIGVAFRPTGAESRGTLYVSAVYENQIRSVALG